MIFYCMKEIQSEIHTFQANGVTISISIRFQLFNLNKVILSFHNLKCSISECNQH